MSLLSLERTTVSDGDLLLGFAAIGAEAFDRLDDVQTTCDVSEDDVLAIQPGSVSRANEELAAIGVRARIGHGHGSEAAMLELEVLIRELVAVDGLAARAVVVGEVAALQHEARDHTVDCEDRGVGDTEQLATERNSGMERAEEKRNAGGDVHVLPLYPKPFSIVHRARKFSAVLGTTSARSSISTRPAGAPPMAMSKKTFGFDIVETTSSSG